MQNTYHYLEFFAPKMCSIIGTVSFTDSTVYSESIGCYNTNAFPVLLSDIVWPHFLYSAPAKKKKSLEMARSDCFRKRKKEKNNNKKQLNKTKTNKQTNKQTNEKNIRKYMSHLVGKPTMWFPNRSDTNRPVQSQKRARSLKFRI